MHGCHGRPPARALITTVLTVGALTAAPPLAAAATPAHRPAATHHRTARPLGSLRLAVLSSRPDLVSAGDTLAQVTVPARVNAATLKVTLGGRDVTSAFAVRPDGRRLALLDGLPLGRSRLVARARRAHTAVLAITNHPAGGPLFAGPQLHPWACPASAVDAQCNAPARFAYAYMPKNGHDFRPYDPARPASDIATTTTDQGVSVPFVIRTETGYLDRDQYRITTLYRPGRPWEPWAPQDQFNHKLLITHGQGCSLDYGAGVAPSTTLDSAFADRGLLARSPTVALGRGFAVLATALDNAGHDCHLVTQAESLEMAKEHFVERYGELRYTIGMGCSGGSMALQQVANAYPGIYDGLVPQCSFPDAWSSATQLFDLHVLRAYLEHPDKWGPGILWDPISIAAVDGHPAHQSAILLDALYETGFGNPARACVGTTAADRWSPANPGGVRCSLADAAVNVFGRRPGDGYAGRPLDNVGVQYGLGGLYDGTLPPALFADLNERVGGVDVNDVHTATRTVADEPALGNAYRSGLINDARRLDRVPIIDLRGSDEGLLHDVFRSFALRARLDLAHGTHANQVIWQGPAPSIGGFDFSTRGLLAMDRWLTAIEADHASGTLPQKVIRDKPADVKDTCEAAGSLETPSGGCPLFVRAYKSPRIVAGDSIATLTNKCALKPLDRAAYPVRFTDAEWAKLQRAFPTGVCDFSRPPVGMTPSLPWLDYTSAIGGTPLP